MAAAADAPIIRGPAMAPPEAAVAVDGPPPMEAPSIIVPMLPAAPGQELAIAEPPPLNSRSRTAELMAKLPGAPKMPSIQAPERLRNLNAKKRCISMLRNFPAFYCKHLASYPWAFLIAYAIIIVIVISAGWRPVTVNTDIEAFRRYVGDAERNQSSYNEALKFQKAVKNASSLADRETFEVRLFYEAKSGTAFSEAALRDIRSLEQLLRNLPGWKRMCQMSDPASRFRCEPGESLGNYAWPRRKELVAKMHTPFNLTFDGDSRERLPVKAFLTYLHEGEVLGRESGPGLRKFLPQQTGGPQDDAKVLRTIFSFTAPSVNSPEFAKEYKEFVSKELFPALKNATERAEDTPDDPWVAEWAVRLYFRGHEIESHEVRYYLEGDLKLAIGAFVLTFLFVWMQLRSLLLAFVGVGQVCLVPLIAYVIVRVDELSLASFMCIFLVLGLGTNDLLAAQEYWKRIGRDMRREDLYPENKGVGFKDKRDAYYSEHLSRFFVALFLRFLPQCLTMTSYLVLLYSYIRPIREFGLFMFTSFVIACLLCIAIFPPLLVMHEVYVHQIGQLPPETTKPVVRIAGMILEPPWKLLPWKPLARQLLRLADEKDTKPAKIVWGGTAIVTLIIFIITLTVGFNRDGVGLPEVYSPSHHGNAGRPLVESFAPAFPAVVPPLPWSKVCELSGATAGSCGLYWCEAPKAAKADASSTTTAAPTASPTNCVCHRPSATISGTCHWVNVSTTVSGQSFLDANETTRLSAVNDYLKKLIPSSVSMIFDGEKATPLSSLVQEHWESGLTNVEPVLQMPVAHVKASSKSDAPTSANTCSYRTACYCGSRVCETPNGVITTGHNVILPAMPQTGRRLASTAATAASTKDVNVVFGVLALDEDRGDDFLMSRDSWEFDKLFEPTSPWAQRAMRDLCEETPDSLQVVQKQCWIQGFRTWMLDQGMQFPTGRFGDFQADLKRFLREKSDTQVTAMWFDADGNMTGTAFTFKVLADSKTSSKKILDKRKEWIDYVNSMNKKAKTSASSAWPTSQMWVDAQAIHESITNAWNIAILSSFIVTFAGLIYTWDFLLPAIIFLVSFIAMIYLAFFMFCIFGWDVGPWEVILLIVFLMHSVEPAFRIGRGVVWGRKLYWEMAVAGNAVQPVKMPQAGAGAMALEDQEAAAPPLALQDGAAPPLAAADQLALPPPTDQLALPRTGLSKSMSSTSLGDDGPEVLEGEDTEFESRLRILVLNITNATLGSAAKLIVCGFLSLFCEFRLFTRLGVVAMLVPLVTVPCIFILLPTAMVLLPVNRCCGSRGKDEEQPDAISLYEIAKKKYDERQAQNQ